MEGVSNYVAVRRPNYRSTAKGAVAGAAVGAAALGTGYGVIKASKHIVKKAEPEVQKQLIGIFSNSIEAAGVDMSKTTVSKVLNTVAKSFVSPKTVAKTVAPLAAVGAALGFGIDLIKNNKAKKAVNKTFKA